MDIQPITRSPQIVPVIKAATINEAPGIISNKIFVALSKVFFFISSPPIVLYDFRLPSISNYIGHLLKIYL